MKDTFPDQAWNVEQTKPPKQELPWKRVKLYCFVDNMWCMETKSPKQLLKLLNTKSLNSNGNSWS